MTYSVWNQAAGAYDYYEVPGSPGKVNAPVPTHLRQTKLGMTAREAAWRLPSGAKLVGSGAEARGRVASSPSQGLGFFDPIGIVGTIVTTPWLLVASAATVGYVLWRRRR